MSDNTEVLVLRGTLEGHNGWVTSLSTCPANPDLLLSSSRDKTLIVWQLTRDESQYGVAKKALRGHSHIVEDCQLTADGQYALSGSWDKTLRLWNVANGECVTRFDGHTGDVMSVSISRNFRQFISASRDKTIKVWNALGDCMLTLKSHQDWVSSVECSPSKDSILYSAGWDKTVKVRIRLSTPLLHNQSTMFSISPPTFFSLLIHRLQMMI
jgi:guanine nucleotide-binding protein subunit beta-2-like 1 protein